MRVFLILLAFTNLFIQPQARSSRSELIESMLNYFRSEEIAFNTFSQKEAYLLGKKSRVIAFSANEYHSVPIRMGVSLNITEITLVKGFKKKILGPAIDLKVVIGSPLKEKNQFLDEEYKFIIQNIVRSSPILDRTQIETAMFDTVRLKTNELTSQEFNYFIGYVLRALREHQLTK